MNVGPNQRIAGATLSKRLWVFIAENGGWWTSMELRDHFLKEGIDINKITWTVLAMLDRKEVVKLPGTHPKYAVTKDCIVPRGLTCAELLTAMGAR